MITKELMIEPANRSRWLKRMFKFLGLLLLVAFAALAGSAMLTKVPGEENIASGAIRNQAVYVDMRDGTLIAVDIWLPLGMQRNARLPVLMVTTRYWRAQQVGWLARALYGLGLRRGDLAINARVEFMNRRGFIVLMVDARGTGASGGNRLAEWAPVEVGDLGELAHWASLQPWSNGHVGAMGVSYSGNTAELLASTGDPSVKAVAPLYDDFDPQLNNSNPGGVFNSGFITAWGEATGAMDRNDVCALAETSGPMCLITKWIVSGVKRVDADRSGAQLESILRSRKSNNVLNALIGVEFRDDKFKDAGGLTLADISPFARRAEVEKHQVPMMIWSSWMDAATTDGTLSRFLTVKSPQQVIIGAWSHGGGHDADPFVPVDVEADPLETDQWATIADFFDAHLRNASPSSAPNLIRYFTMGERKWRETPTWPPPGMMSTSYYFGNSSSLVDAVPTASASDTYTVNFTASAGKQTRWATQNGGSDVIYPDRRQEDKKLLTYTSAPLAEATRITGTPIVTVHMSTSAMDGLVIAYLEDVAPDGRVTYVTEGVLRFNNRNETTAPLPYASLGVNRSFRRRDALPVLPGDIMKLRLPLYATSVQIKAGHSIRIALAGAADGSFDRLPKTGMPTWTVERSAARPSGVELPIMKSYFQ